MTQVQPSTLVADLADRWSDLETSFHEAYWESQVRASPEAEQSRVELELRLRRFKGDASLLQAVDEALSTEIREPMLQRQLEVVRLSLVGNQMTEARRARLVELSSAVEGEFAAYRPEIDGRRYSDNDILEVLQRSPDEDLRRRVWEGSKEVGAVVAERVRDLARLRNEIALDLGFRDYYRMSLELQELPEGWVFDIMAELEALSAGPFEQWKQGLDAGLCERFQTRRLQPWHYADPFFQHLPAEGSVGLDSLLGNADATELVRATFGAWDLDMDGVLSRSDLYPRAAKCQHAFCIDIDRRGDVRILANIVPGERWIETMLHESGHAAYDASIDRRLPYFLRRPANTFVTEAIALLCGRLMRDERWLTGTAGLSSAEIEPLLAELRRADAAQKALFARWGLVMVHFERELYSDPEGDLDRLWWDLVERFQGVTRPQDRRAPDWAAKIHVAAAPVYYQNYLLGELLASQLEATCDREAGGIAGRPEAGRVLRERIFAHGAARRWEELIEDATGRPLSAEDFAGSLEQLR